jgi:uncharacterized protein (TIGR02117 family)
VTRWVAAAAAVLVAAPVAYLLLALALGLVPVNADFTPPSAGAVAIYVRTNGVHAELVLPARAPHDWTGELPPHTIVRDARAITPLEWLAFGWGDRAFYLQTPHWRDLRFVTAFNSLAGRGPAAMHVEYLARPQDYRAIRVDIDRAQYQRLVDYVRAGFARDARGMAARIDHPGYFATDAFFEGAGHYSPRLTSNEWVRRALAQAGIRTAVWAPFDVAIFWQLQRISAPPVPRGSRATRAPAWPA